MDKLLPCPFCGSEAETFEASEDSFSILCTGCGVETPYLPYLTEAIAAWNRRVEVRQLALKTRVCPMCEDCPDGCPVETPKDSRNIVTNADRKGVTKDNSIILDELIPRCTPKAAELLKSGLLGAIKVCAVNECIHV